MSEVGEVPREVTAGAVPKSQEAEKPSLDALLVFGQGPVINKDTREQAEKAQTEPGTEDVNFWSQTLAEAAAELFKRGQTREIVVMGGRTGGGQYGSEAELISKYLQEFGVPKDRIRLEDRSTNTLENITNALNAYLDKDKEQYQNLGILGTNYHISRIRLLMEMFGIDYKTVFSAEEVLRYVARFDVEGREKEVWDQKALAEFERRLDMNEAGKVPTYYGQKLGMERNTVARRGQEEDVWSKALLEIPQYWIGYLGSLENTARIREVLTKTQDPEILRERFGIDLASDSDETLRKKLLAIKRRLPDVDQSILEGWPQSTQEKLEGIVSQRRASKQ